MAEFSIPSSIQCPLSVTIMTATSDFIESTYTTLSSQGHSSPKVTQVSQKLNARAQSIPYLPAEVSEMILRKTDSGSLLRCRLVSTSWNQLTIPLLKTRTFTLRKDWFKRRDKMKIFQTFPTIHSTLWSAFYCPQQFQVPSEIRTRFLDQFGPVIKKCYFDCTPINFLAEPLEILKRMPNLEEMYLEQLDDYLNAKGLKDFTLPNLKFIRIPFCINPMYNEHNFGQLLGLTTPALERIEIENFNLMIFKQPERILDILQQFPCFEIVMKLHLDHNFPSDVMEKYQLNIVDLTLSSFQCEGICHANLLKSFQVLSRLYIHTTYVGGRIPLSIPLPYLPALCNLSIQVLCTGEQEHINIIVSCPAELFPKLKTVTLISQTMMKMNLPELFRRDEGLGTQPCRLFGFLQDAQGEEGRINFNVPKKVHRFDAHQWRKIFI